MASKGHALIRIFDLSALNNQLPMHVPCSQQKLKGRKRWIISVPVRGSIWLEPEAVHAVKDRHRSLFSVGVVKVGGTHQRWQVQRLNGLANVQFVRYGAPSLFAQAS